MNKLSLYQIQIFNTVAAHLNISSAARELYITPSAVSKQIQNIEDILGTKLFERHNSGLVLKPAGEELFFDLDFMYHRVSNVLDRIQSFSVSGDKPMLRIICVDDDDVIGAYNRIAEAFNKKYTDVKLIASSGDISDVRDILLCGRVDIAVTFSSTYYGVEGLNRHDLTKLDYYFLLSPDYKGGRDENSLCRYLSAQPLLLPRLSECFNYKDGMLDICARSGIIPESIRYMPNYITLSRAINRGCGFTIGGVSVINRYAFRDIEDRFLWNYQCVRVNPDFHDDHISVFWRSDNENERVSRFVEMLQTENTDASALPFYEKIQSDGCEDVFL